MRISFSVFFFVIFLLRIYSFLGRGICNGNPDRLPRHDMPRLVAYE